MAPVAKTWVLMFLLIALAKVELGYASEHGRVPQQLMDQLEQVTNSALEHMPAEKR